MTSLEEVRASELGTISVKDAAVLLGVDPRTVTGALSVHGGEIPARRVGRRVVIPREAFLSWLDGPGKAVEPTPIVADESGDARQVIRAKLIALLGELENAS